jgi:hypothetical protein
LANAEQASVGDPALLANLPPASAAPAARGFAQKWLPRALRAHLGKLVIGGAIFGVAGGFTLDEWTESRLPRGVRVLCIDLSHLD